MAPLTEAEKQRQQQRAGEHVSRYRRLDGISAGEHPQNEPAGDAQHVDPRVLLELERVRDLKNEVGHRHRKKLRWTEGGTAEGDDQQADDHDLGECRRHRARSDGTFPLDGMMPIRLDVDQIVERVDGASEKTEDAKSAERTLDDGGVGEVFGKHHRSQDEQILDPLVRPHRAQHAGEPHEQRRGRSTGGRS